MKIEEHVLVSLDGFTRKSHQEALMHACIALDATATKLLPGSKGKKAYKQCIRDYIWLIEPFTGAGINLEETKWTNLNIDNGYGKKINEPDLADIIYHVFRCNHAHGHGVPPKFDLTLSLNSEACGILISLGRVSTCPIKLF